MPLSWPIGSGKELWGSIIYILTNLFYISPTKKQDSHDTIKITSLNDPELVNQIGNDAAQQLIDDGDLFKFIHLSKKMIVYREKLLQFFWLSIE